jgi:hypothetical protein
MGVAARARNSLVGEVLFEFCVFGWCERVDRGAILCVLSGLVIGRDGVCFLPYEGLASAYSEDIGW